MGEDDDGCDERPPLPLSSSHLCLLGQLQRGETVSFWFVFYFEKFYQKMKEEEKLVFSFYRKMDLSLTLQLDTDYKCG